MTETTHDTAINRVLDEIDIAVYVDRAEAVASERADESFMIAQCLDDTDMAALSRALGVVAFATATMTVDDTASTMSKARAEMLLRTFGDFVAAMHEGQRIAATES